MLDLTKNVNKKREAFETKNVSLFLSMFPFFVLKSLRQKKRSFFCQAFFVRFLSGQVSVFVRKQLLTTMDKKKGLGFLYS